MSKFGIAYIVIASSIHSAIVMLAAELRPCLVEGPRQQLVRHILSIALTLVAIWLAGLGDKTLIDDQYNVDLRQRMGRGFRLDRNIINPWRPTMMTRTTLAIAVALQFMAAPVMAQVALRRE